ncbi:O-antigen polymerase [Bacillus cereus]|uniref:O-antigen polymerase n=1 Tax=Bacillus cereus TaxID=1396 RepID=UPI000BEC778E|nr:O-antigen polymerase [Bacillus cereus]PDY79667.1 hypothetical protein CON06_24160 [Bacillus cereus]PGL61290.1 hypothetical protein CN927_11995 [Bacillus cereus]
MIGFFVLTILMSLFFLGITYIKNKEINIIVFTFNMLWTIITLIFYINTSNNSLSAIDEVYFSILGLLFFTNIGFFIFMPSSKNYSNIDKLSEEKVNMRMLTSLLIFCLVLVSIFMRRVAEPLLRGDLTSIRKMIYYAEVGSENSLYSSGLETILIQWLANSLIMAIFVVVTVLFILGLCNYKLLSLSFMAGVLFAVLTGGRMMLLKLVIILFSAIILFKMKDIRFMIKRNILHIVRRRKNRLFFTIFFTIFIALMLTVMRDSSNTDSDGVFTSILGYLSNPILYFSTLLENNNFTTGPLLGGGFIGGMLRPIDLVLENLSGASIDFPSDILVNETQIFLNIGDGVLYNALPTMLYAFYRDAGILGICINSLLMTIFISYTYKLFLKQRTVRSMALYILSFYLVLMGILRWEPSFVQFWLTLLFIWILTRTKKAP